MENTLYDTIILGAGTAGLSAAIYAARSGLQVLIIEKTIQGGQIIYSPEIGNYPGILDISGTDFVNTLYQQATRLGVKVVYETVQEMNLLTHPKSITTTKNKYIAKTVIVANGAEHRHLNVEGEERLKGKGVSYCATCDGAFFKNKDVCVVGGGNTALDDAIYLSNLCETVYIIHRRDQLRGDQSSVQLAKQHQNIIFVFDSVVEKILGEESVVAVEVKNVKTNAKQTIDVSAVFVAIGLEPHNALFANVLKIDEDGYILAGENCKTNIDGVFVAGDTRTKELRQLVTAAADGAVAATSCAKYILSLGV